MDALICTCWLVVTVASQHLDPSGMNQRNLGIGLEVDRWIAGGFDNSINRTSFYGGREFLIIEDEHLKAGVALGIMSGYQHDGIPNNLPHGDSRGYLSPLVSPFISYEVRNVGFNVTFQPKPNVLERISVWFSNQISDVGSFFKRTSTPSAIGTTLLLRTLDLFMAS